VSLAAPLFLALLALAAPVVWAFLARRRAPKAVVGSVLLLRAAAGRASTRLVAPRLREPLALALTLLALLAVAAGLAGPSCGPSGAGRVVVVVDGSASLARRTARGDTLLDLGAAVIGQQLAARPAGARAALVVAGDDPRVVVGLTQDLGRVAEAAAAVVPAGGSAGLAAALRLADALCADPASDTVIVLSDHLPDGAPSRCPTRRVPLPTTGDNVGIAELVARRGDGLGLVEVLVGVAGDVPRSVEATFRVDGRLVDTARLDVGGETVAWTLRRLEVDGDEVRVDLLELGDALPADDAAVVRAPRPEPISVALVTDRPRGFVATALGLHPGVSLRLTPADGPPVDGAELVVLEVPAEVAPGIPVVAIGPAAAAAAGVRVGPPALEPRIVRWAFEDPRLAFVELDGVVVTRAAPLEVPPGGVALVEAIEGPLAVSGELDGRSVTALGFRAAETDLVLRPGFLHLLANLVEHAVPRLALPPGAPAAGGVAEVLRPPPGPATELLGAAGTVGWPWARWLVGLGWLALLVETGLAAALGLVAWRRA
jgi:hypothetical protein